MAAAESVSISPPVDVALFANQPALAAPGFIDAAPADAADYFTVASAEPAIFDVIEPSSGCAPVQLGLRDRHDRAAADRVLLAGLAGVGENFTSEGPFWGGPIDPTAVALSLVGILVAGLFLRTRLEYRPDADWLPAPA
jgi:hypothetical protein